MVTGVGISISGPSRHNTKTRPTLSKHLLQIRRNDIWSFPSCKVSTFVGFALVDHGAWAQNGQYEQDPDPPTNVQKGPKVEQDLPIVRAQTLGIIINSLGKNANPNLTPSTHAIARSLLGIFSVEERLPS
jgi:hypothetical protein